MAKKPTQLDANGYRKFGFVDKLAYAAGDFGCNMSFALKGTVQTFWLAFMHMESTLFGTLLLIVQIWDAINDPIIGSVIDADKRDYKKGKFKSYIFLGSIGLLVAGSLVFIPVPNASKTIKCILFLLGYIVWDAFYTIANVPYGSMLSLITEDPAERTQLSTWRSIGSIAGNIFPMVFLPMLIWRNRVDASGNVIMNVETGEPEKELVGNIVFLVAVIMGVLGFIAFQFMIKKSEIRVNENAVKVGEGGGKFNIFKAFANFMKNRAAVGATLAAMGMFIGMQSAGTATQIMFAIHFGKPELSGLATALGSAPMFLCMPFITKLVKKYGKKEACAGASILSLAGGALMFLFPLMPSKTLGMVMFIVALAVYGIGLGVYSCVSWALMADAIDYNEWKTGSREEGTVYSLHSFFRKLAQGVGPAAAVYVMGFLGYNSEIDINAQTPETAQNMCWLVAGLYLVGAIFQFVGLVLVYNLDKKTLETMTKELNERKTK